MGGEVGVVVLEILDPPVAVGAEVVVVHQGGEGVEEEGACVEEAEEEEVEVRFK